MIISWISLILFPIFCLLILDYCNYKALTKDPSVRIYERLLEHYHEFPTHVLFSVIVVYLLFILLLLIFKYAWAATSILGVISILFSYINYMKIMINSMPFIPTDFSLAGQTKELVSFISLAPPKLLFVAAFILIVWILILAYLGVKLPGKWYITSAIGLVALILLCYRYGLTDAGPILLSRFDMDIFDNVLQSSNYTANGFVGGFVVNLIALHTEEPEDYSKDRIVSILSDFSGIETEPDAEDFDIILILAESFFDPRTLDGITYSENILENYDKIIADPNCYSGMIHTIAHGGGTVNTEFRILTGLSTDRLLSIGATPYNYVKNDMDTYVTNYKRNGYQTIGIHLYNPTFYNRKNTYPHIGFDHFYSLDDVAESIFVDYTRGYATDDSTERAIEYYMDQATATDDSPLFVFAITIENHTPYGENENNTVEVDTGPLSEKAALALTTYSQGVKDADQMIAELRNYIDNRDRPTALIWFGDHLPTLGDSYTPYYTLHYFEDDYWNVENRKLIFSTPFFVYANRPLKQGIFTSKDDNRISDIYLMECVAASTGFNQTPYMQYLSDKIKTLPIYNVELNMDWTLNQEQLDIVHEWELIGYDQLLGKRYSAVSAN